MPSRDTVWKSIPSAKSSDKYRHLSPRKLVNNFTRENHRYNYDPNYTSGEESMDDFIVDSDVPVDSSSSSNSSSEKKQTAVKGSGKKRVKNYKKRVIIEDSESDSDITETNKEEKTTGNDKTKRTETKNSDNVKLRKPLKRTCKIELENSNKTVDTRAKLRKVNQKKSSKNYNVESSSSDSGAISAVNGEEAESGDEDMYLSRLTPCRKRCKSNVIVSDDDEDGGPDKEEQTDVTGRCEGDNSESNNRSKEIDKEKLNEKSTQSTDLLHLQCNKSVDCVDKVKVEIMDKSDKCKEKTSSDSEKGTIQSGKNKSKAHSKIDDELESSDNDSDSDIETSNNTDKKNKDRCVVKDEKQNNDKKNGSESSESSDESGTDDSDVHEDEPGTSKGKSKGENAPNNANSSLEVLRKLVKNLDRVDYDSDTSESGSDTEEEVSDDDDEDSESEESEPENSASKARLVKKKKAKLELFEKFRVERERKLSKEQKHV